MRKKRKSAKRAATLKHKGECHSKTGICGYDAAVLFLRLGLSMFIIHGWSKLANIGATTQFFAGIGMPAPELLAPFVGLVELLGGIAILLGIFTYPAAILLSIIMIVALLSVKLAAGWPAMEIDLAFLSMSLAMVYLHPGKYSLEKMLGK